MGMLKADSDYIRFKDALEYAELAIKDLGNLGFEDFKQNQLLVDATIRRVEVVGEALGGISDKTKYRYPEIPFSEARGMRNILAHDYGSIDLMMVWKTVAQDFTELADLLHKIVDM